MEYKCQICNTQYYDKSALNKHFKSKKHIANEQGIDKKKTYQCDECPYSSKDCANYKRHMQTHIERKVEYKFKCTLCDEIFKTDAALEHHVSQKRINHLVPITINTLEDNRPIHYKCTKCNKIYPTEQFYLKHLCNLENDPDSIPLSDSFIIEDGLYTNDGNIFIFWNNQPSKYKLEGTFEKILPANKYKYNRKNKSIEAKVESLDEKN